MKMEMVDIAEINEVIMAYAKGDFSRRLKISSQNEEQNAIAAGINLIGEKLPSKIISRAYFKQIYNSFNQFVIITDLEYRITYINQYILQFLSPSKKKWIGKKVIELFNEPISISLEKLSRQNNPKSHTFNSKLLIGNQLIPIACSVTLISDTKQKINSLLFIASDLSESLQFEKKLLKATIDGQERERKRMAYDLHDSLGQELNGIMMHLNVLEKMNSKKEIYRDTLNETKELLSNAIDSVRLVSFNLMPKFLLKESLEVCIREMIKRINSIAQVKINLDLNIKNVTFKDRNDEILIFRIIQEFITNSIKHANTNEIDLTIDYDESDLNKMNVFLRDYGKGFDIERVIKENGLNSLITRLDALSAAYTFSSQVHDGTKLNFHINEATYQNTNSR